MRRSATATMSATRRGRGCDMVLRPRNGLSLCAGGGGLDMGLMLAEPGFHTRCFVEWEEYPRSTIIAAQRAGYFAPAPIWDDLTTFDARTFRGALDIVLAGYPCQPFSHAGQRRGEDDPRHLWPHVARVVRECDPEWVFLENVSGHVTLGAETVLRELRDMGYTAAAGLFSAAETGAPHERLRWFCVAHRDSGFGARRMDGGGFGGAAEGSQECDAGEGEALYGQRLRAEPGGGSDELADAGSGRHGGSRQGQTEQPRRAETVRAGDDVGNAARFGRGEGWTEPVIRGGRDTASGAGGAMEHTSGSRREPAGTGPSSECEGRQPLPRSGSRTMADANGGNASTEGLQRGGEQRLHPEGGRSGGRGDGVGLANAERNAGYQGGCGRGRDKSAQGTWEADCAGAQRPFLHPPGPADMGRWADVLVTSPDLAPSASFGDLASFAGHLAQMVARGDMAEAEIEPALRRMADGLALRSRALRLLGNGVHPLAAAYAWRSLAAAHGLVPVDLGAAAGNEPDRANVAVR